MGSCSGCRSASCRSPSSSGVGVMRRISVSAFWPPFPIALPSCSIVTCCSLKDMSHPTSDTTFEPSVASKSGTDTASPTRPVIREKRSMRSFCDVSSPPARSSSRLARSGRSTTVASALAKSSHQMGWMGWSPSPMRGTSGSGCAPCAAAARSARRPGHRRCPGRQIVHAPRNFRRALGVALGAMIIRLARRRAERRDEDESAAPSRAPSRRRCSPSLDVHASKVASALSSTMPTMCSTTSQPSAAPWMERARDTSPATRRHPLGHCRASRSACRETSTTVGHA